MNPKRRSKTTLEFHPLTSDRWTDLETLFGARGASSGCWCMWWRLKRSEYVRQQGQGNRQSMKTLVTSGQVPGILAYAEGAPVGWCALAPRESYPRLEQSRVLKRIDDKPVWSVTCFFVRRDHRNKGVSVQLLRAAVDYVKAQGGTLVEGYPVEPKSIRRADASAWTGLVSAFKQVGFAECSRGSPTRPIMRFEIRRQGANRKPRGAS